MQDKGFQLIVITGLSGAGRSQALRSLEDQGYFCVDNLPPMFLVKFADLCAQSRGNVPKAAIVCDLRGRAFFDYLSEALQSLEKEGFPYKILFLEASDETLIHRYKESRRRHPLSPQGRLMDGINKERQHLAELKEKADKVIDTSNLTAQELRQQVAEIFGQEQGPKQMPVTLLSFGFKYGIPMDADLVMDVRFLPNPFYIKELRPLTGQDEAVKDYVFSHQVAQDFMHKFSDLLAYILPHYVKEGKSNLMIAIGCTGGQHRSVAIAERLGEFVVDQGYSVHVKHRDSDKKQKGASHEG